MKVVNVCFRRAVRLYGNHFAPQSLCMDEKEHRAHWEITVSTDLGILKLEALPANPMMARFPNMERRSWIMTLNDVDSIMLETPPPPPPAPDPRFCNVDGCLACVPCEIHKPASAVAADPEPAPAPKPTAVEKPKKK